MLLPRAVKVYVATAPCNLRKIFDGLSNEVRDVLAKDALSGRVFILPYGTSHEIPSGAPVTDGPVPETGRR